MSRTSAPAFTGLQRGARLYLSGVLVLAAIASVLATVTNGDPELDTLLLLIAGALCAGAGLYEVLAPGHYAFQPNLAFFFWGAVLLPPWAIAVLAVLCFVPSGAVHRTRWYMVAFNVANYALVGLTVHEVRRFAGGTSLEMHGAETVLTLVLATATFVALNHMLIAGAVSLSRGLPIRQSLRDTADGLPLDAALAMIGACLAVLWTLDPFLVLLASGPMALVYRALWVPILRHKSQTDSKTGLSNSEHFNQELTQALRLARKRGADVSVVMIDLDQLRLVNNRHGHLAGDDLLQRVADFVIDLTPPTGTAARFGGDEMCMLLPDRSLGAARELAETLRARVEATGAIAPADSDPVPITVSAGVASYPEHGDTATGLLNAADLAVYDAKLGGRNRVRTALPPGTREALNELPSIQDGAPSPIELDPTTRSPEYERPAELEAPSFLSDAPEPAVAEQAEGPSAPSRRLIPFYAALLLGVAAGVGVIASPDAIVAAPLLLAILIASVLVLDLVRIDIFERGTISPSAVPTLALAFLFGPLGPLAAESVAAAVNLARGKDVVKTAFDLGALSLAGAAAAVAFAAVPDDHIYMSLLAGAAAGAAYYAVNVPLLAVVMGLAEGTTPVAPWRERLAWLWPHYVAFGVVAATFVVSELALGYYAFIVFALPIVMLWIAEKQYVDRSRTSVTELRRSHDELELANRRLRGLLGDNQQLLTRMHRSYLSTITSLARTIEAKDPYTGGHTERVAALAQILAEECEFSEPEVQAVNVGALIHDIGKIGISDHILLKQAKLTEEEFAEIRRHPAISSYIVAELELPPIVKQMVRSHHERFDGGGYPDGLVGEEIPLAARILSVADSLDAMTSNRPYRDALPVETARAEIRAQSGSQFCPRVVAALESRFEREPDFWRRFATEAAASTAAAADVPLPAPSAA